MEGKVRVLILLEFCDWNLSELFGSYSLKQNVSSFAENELERAWVEKI